MSFEHAKQEPVAEAEALRPDVDESDEVVDPRLLQLFLDSDGRYRWYEEDEAAPVASDSLMGALEEAESFWEGFQIVEVRGDPVDQETELEDSYAADELEELGLDLEDE